MKVIFYTCLFILSISPAANAANPHDWKTLEKGLEYLKFETTQNEHTITMHALRVDPQQFNIKAVPNEKNTSVKNLAKKSGALAVINANFFDPQGKTLGLVKTDRKVINPIKKVSWWSVLCGRNKNYSIIHSSQVKDGYCHEAVQAGPRLVVDGQVPKLKDEWSQKSAVGITAKGLIILLISENPIPIKSLAQILQKSEAEQGLACVNALNLDGGSSSQMYIETANFSMSVPNYIKIPVGLGVFRKSIN